MAYEKKDTICTRLQNAIFCSLNLLAMAITLPYRLLLPETATLFIHRFLPGQQVHLTCAIVPVTEPPDL
jgi:hypothetical protein